MSDESRAGSLSDALTPAAVRAGDPQGMAAAVAGLGDQLAHGWTLFGETVDGLRADDGGAGLEFGTHSAVVVCGMGGSAIGGDVVACLAGQSVPMTVTRGYEPPAWVGPHTLLIAVSYSGGTEETLAAVRAASRRGCVPVCVTTGGELGALAENHRWPLLRVPSGLMPRAALGYLIAALLAVVDRVGLVVDAEAQVAETVAVLRSMAVELGPEVAEERNLAKRLARSLVGRLPCIYGFGATAPAARRWKCQVNENAKHPSLWAELPELDHNEVVGWEGERTLLNRLAVITLADARGDERLLRRLRPTLDFLASRSDNLAVVDSRGVSPLARCCSALYVGDWTSVYLGIVNGVDPTPIVAIDELKAARAAAVLRPTRG